MNSLAVIKGPFQNLLSHICIVEILFFPMKDLKEGVLFDLEILKSSQGSAAVRLVNEGASLAQRSCFMIYRGGFTAQDASWGVISERQIKIEAFFMFSGGYRPLRRFWGTLSDHWFESLMVILYCFIPRSQP